MISLEDRPLQHPSPLHCSYRSFWFYTNLTDDFNIADVNEIIISVLKMHG